MEGGAVSEEVQPKKRRFTIVRIVITLAFLALLSYIALALISGRGLDFGWLTDFLFSGDEREVVEELHFNIGRNRVFADLDNAVAAAGTLGVQVLDFSGVELFRDSVSMGNPAINSQNGYAIAFDIGGVEARIFNANGRIASIATEGQIISASINQNGWFTINSQIGEGFRGSTSVFNNNGVLVYRVSMASGYILSSAISPDNSSLAILNLTDYGSRVTFYHGLHREYEDGAFDLPDSLIFDIQFLPSGDLLAVTTQSLVLIDPHGVSGWEIFSFADLRMGGYIIGDEFIALYLLDFGIGHRGDLVLVDHFGNLFGELTVERELISMSFYNDNLSVMLSNGLFVLDRNLNIIALSDEAPSAAGVSRIIALDSGKTLVAGDRFAVLVS
jgi:hypothetical protein